GMVWDDVDNMPEVTRTPELEVLAVKLKLLLTWENAVMAVVNSATPRKISKISTPNGMAIASASLREPNQMKNPVVAPPKIAVHTPVAAPVSRAAPITRPNGMVSSSRESVCPGAWAMFGLATRSVTPWGLCSTY